MARTIAITEDLAFDMLDLIDGRAGGLREDAGEARRQGRREVAGELAALAESWESSARTIRIALGIYEEEEDRVRLACATCWEHLEEVAPAARFVDHVVAPFARCDMCGTAGEDEEIIEYEWKEA